MMRASKLPWCEGWHVFRGRDLIGLVFLKGTMSDPQDLKFCPRAGVRCDSLQEAMEWLLDSRS